MPDFDKKISIIVPVYNVSNYLKRCLDSLIIQPYEDLEFICIDDGSTDNSLEILNNYAQKDHRFVIISQENRGTGHARNVGIDKARGEYIMFVDSDDWIEDNAIEMILEEQKKNKSQVSVFNYQRFDDYSGKIRKKSYAKHFKKKFGKTLNNGDSYNWHAIKKHCMTGITGQVWDKIYLTSFIKNHKIYFFDCSHGEDQIFSQKVLFFADKITYIDHYIYNYRERKNSAISKVSDDNFHIFHIICEIGHFLADLGILEELQAEFRRYKVLLLSYHSNVLPERQQEYLNEAKKMLTPFDYFRLCQRINSGGSFLENIFSIKNKNKNGEKLKIITILGKKIQIKKEVEFVR